MQSNQNNPSPAPAPSDVWTFFTGPSASACDEADTVSADGPRAYAPATFIAWEAED